MKTVLSPGHRKTPLLILAMSCLLAVLIISPPTALALNLPIDPTKITLTTEDKSEMPVIHIDRSKPSGSPADAAENSDIVIAFTIGSATYTVNGEPMVMDAVPTIIEGRIMVPVRYVAEPLGARVDWEAATMKVTVVLDESIIELWVGQSNASVNGKAVPIDPDNPNVKPLIMNERTMLPLRFVAENLGCDVQWEEATQKVTITKTGPSPGSGKMPDLRLPGVDFSAIEPQGKITDVIKVPGETSDPVQDTGRISDIALPGAGFVDVGLQDTMPGIIWNPGETPPDS